MARALSEYEHITKGLVAQFGQHVRLRSAYLCLVSPYLPKKEKVVLRRRPAQVFGKAWDYDFTDASRASLSDWLECEPRGPPRSFSRRGQKNARI